MKSYEDLAETLAVEAPAQGRLLRYFLSQRGEMQPAEVIISDLKMTDANFRVLTEKLRDKGVEIVCLRTHAPDQPSVDVRYLYGLNSTSVEGWSDTRRQAVMTAWKRTTKVFERHLLALDLPTSEIYKILGVMEYVSKTLEDISLDVSEKAEKKQAALVAEKVASA